MRVPTKDKSAGELARATRVAQGKAEYLAFEKWHEEGKGENLRYFAIFKSRAKLGQKKPYREPRDSRGRQSLYRR